MRNGNISLARRRGEARLDARGFSFKRRARGIPLILVLVAFVYTAMNVSPFVGPDLPTLSGLVFDKDEMSDSRDSRVPNEMTALHYSHVPPERTTEKHPREVTNPTSKDQTPIRSSRQDTEKEKSPEQAVPSHNKNIRPKETETPITSEETIPTHNTDNTNPYVDGWPEQCSLYLAPSTIPNSGLGMYTAVDLDQGDNIGPADIIVPMINIEWHNDNTYKGWDNPESRTNGFHFLYENYVWMASAVDMMHEAERVHVMSHGFGALANSLPGLVNLDEGMPDYNGGGLHRVKDPGAGAFTPYHNRQATALEPVPAGGELFADYGSNWFKSRTNMIGYIPLSEDFDEADALLKKFEAFASQPPRWDKQLETLKNDFIGLIRNFSEVKFEAFASAPGWGDISQETKNDFLGLIRNFNATPRVLNALPSSTADLDLAISKGTRELKREIKSPEWLKENGKCMDNLRPLPSTISQAGRGAFATRFLAEGSLVVTAPLIQVPRARDVFRQYAYNLTASGEWIRDPERPAGYQLMMNYCFGHPDSTMMFSPYGPSVSFVNHDRERANVRLEWSDPDHEWLSRSVDQMESTYNAQLSFDLIATRDIEAGEEVFLDYGVEWQAAWDEYVEGWSAPAGEYYIDADDLNTKQEYELLRTKTEQGTYPYPANVMTRCRYATSKEDDGWDNPIKSPLLYHIPWSSLYDESQHHPCSIISRRVSEGGDFFYVVLIHPVQDSTLGSWGQAGYRQGGLPKGKSVMVIDMPRNAIEFKSRRYQSDFHLASAFRHEIVVPDELFPKSWRNLLNDGHTKPRNKSLHVDGWPEQCGLYLAPSTIPNSGLGMYTAVDLNEGDEVGPADIIVPVINIEWHNDNTYKGWDNPKKRSSRFHFLYESYFWSGLAVDIMHEAELPQAMSHGFGALANSLPGLVNLDEGMPDYNGGGLHRAKDPGAGAFTPYHNRQATAFESIPAGGELFVEYGHGWFEGRSAEIGYIPFSEDFDEADALLKKFEAFASEAPGWGDISQEMKDAFWLLIRNFNDESRVLNALPFSTADLDLAIRKGTRELKREIKSPEWLKENGKCMDNLRPLPSTISQAGRGAFATRFLAEGSLVVTAPLIQVPRARDVFRQYAYNLTASGEWIRDPERPAGYQLMMNYCFGHPDSTMMFSPYGPSVSFVNHDRERANVRLEWSDPDHEWLSRSVDQMESTYNAQLSFDLIATRDIEAGEEVFLDYGVEWQAAWDEYVEGWSAPAGSEHFIDAEAINVMEDDEILRTKTEQEIDPYPENVRTVCRCDANRYGWDGEDQKPGAKQITWSAAFSNARLHPCSIISRRKAGAGSDGFLYTVHIHPVQDSTLGYWGQAGYRQGGLPKGQSLIVRLVPRDAIEFQSRRYQSDFHLANAFRHEIVVPDELFPKSWRNLGGEGLD